MAIIDQTPKREEWSFVRGATLENPFQLGVTYEDGSFVPTDLTGWTIIGHIRRTEDSETLLATITGTPDPVQINETKGVYVLSVPADETAGLPTKCVGDVRFETPTGELYFFQRFEFVITKNVTQIA